MLCAPVVTPALHDALLATFGVGVHRPDMQALRAETVASAIPWQQWWGPVSNTKNYPQWVSRVQRTGEAVNVAGLTNKADVGAFIYRRLTKEGEIADGDLQPAI